jgi:uncharacterized cupin superfamily protein
MSIVRAAVNGELQLESYDLPAEAVIAGDPRPRAWTVTREDGAGQKVISGVLEADPGTIRYPIRGVDTLYVLKGHAHVELDGGDVVDLGPGDVAVLPPGGVATWTFTEPFKEIFVLSGVPA